MPKRNPRPKPNAEELFPRRKPIEDAGGAEISEPGGARSSAPTVPETPIDLPEVPMKTEPVKNKKQSYSAFLTELFQTENPMRFRQMNQLLKYLSPRYSEDDVMNALRHYYRYSEKAPNIADWCVWEAYEKTVGAVEAWREFERVKNLNAKSAKDSKAEQMFVYKKSGEKENG